MAANFFYARVGLHTDEHVVHAECIGCRRTPIPTCTNLHSVIPEYYPVNHVIHRCATIFHVMRHIVPVVTVLDGSTAARHLPNTCP